MMKTYKYFKIFSYTLDAGKQKCCHGYQHNLLLIIPFYLLLLTYSLRTGILALFWKWAFGSRI